MIKQLVLGIVLPLTYCPANAQPEGNSIKPSWPAATNDAKPGTRWWWMGSAVNKEDLKWNIRQYAQAGIGTLEITPIYGVQGNEKNELPFLSGKWMEAYNQTVNFGKENQVSIDLNCGTGWPFGGPDISITDAAAKLTYVDTTVIGKDLQKGVDISVADKKEKDYAILQRVMLFSEDGTAKDITSLSDNQYIVKWKKANKKSTYRMVAIYCSRTRQKVKRAAPGGEGYVLDHFDKAAVARYLSKFDKAFKMNTAVFPQSFFNDSYEVYKANWTPTLLQEFEKRRGYKLEEHILELLGEKEDKDNQVLSDYRETLAELLLENFTIQWTDWAHQHGSTTRNQAHGSPANLIDIYAAVDIPEIEGFGLSEFGIRGLRRDSGFTRKNDSDVSMLKYASSAAHICGKRLTSSETFTWLTEHFRTSLSQCKPDLDLMFTCGVNHVFFHGTTYSPKNEEWPGWKFYASVDMSPTNSIWRDASYLMSYIERCQSFLQYGQPDNDFLVLLPVRDMWSKRHGKGESSLLMQFDIHSMSKKAPEFIKSILTIDSLGFDCDYISEKYLLSTTFTDGMLQTSGGTRYKALIIPGSGKMSESAKQHLDQLARQGAKIIYGIDNDRMLSITQPEEIKQNTGIRIIRRSNEYGHHYFMVNLSPKDMSRRFKLSVPCKDACWFNPLNGNVNKADINADGVNVSLRSGESMILQTYDTENVTAGIPSLTAYDGAEKELAAPWKLSFAECTPKVSGTFELDSLQTWERLEDDAVKVTMGTGVYSTTITMSATEANKNWLIDLGDVRESARVYVNDSLVGCAWSVPYSLECSKDFWKKGANSLRIEVTNLPANRIAHLDRQQIPWRKFKDTNIVNIHYKRDNYAGWAPVKSGLNTQIRLKQEN
ncbi:MAG: glycosyl hydrolase [Prevotella sp.]